jgi:uncharacterized protein YrrD
MKHKFSFIHGAPVCARDGWIGSVSDIYFDDCTGRIKYVVVSTTNWLLGKIVLISPLKFKIENDRLCSIDLCRDEIRHAPDCSIDPPVYVQKMIQQYSNNLMKLNVDYRDGYAMYYSSNQVDQQEMCENVKNSHLRSIKEVASYRVLCEENIERIGQSFDVIIDDLTWDVMCFIVEYKTSSSSCFRVEMSEIEKFDYSDSSIYLKKPFEQNPNFEFCPL